MSVYRILPYGVALFAACILSACGAASSAGTEVLAATEPPAEVGSPEELTGLWSDNRLEHESAMDNIAMIFEYDGVLNLSGDPATLPGPQDETTGRPQITYPDFDVADVDVQMVEMHQLMKQRGYRVEYTSCEPEGHNVVYDAPQGTHLVSIVVRESAPDISITVIPNEVDGLEFPRLWTSREQLNSDAWERARGIADACPFDE